MRSNRGAAYPDRALLNPPSLLTAPYQLVKLAARPSRTCVLLGPSVIPDTERHKGRPSPHPERPGAGHTGDWQRRTRKRSMAWSGMNTAGLRRGASASHHKRDDHTEDGRLLVRQRLRLTKVDGRVGEGLAGHVACLVTPRSCLVQYEDGIRDRARTGKAPDGRDSWRSTWLGGKRTRS